MRERDGGGRVESEVDGLSYRELMKACFAAHLTCLTTQLTNGLTNTDFLNSCCFKSIFQFICHIHFWHAPSPNFPWQQRRSPGPPPPCRSPRPPRRGPRCAVHFAALRDRARPRRGPAPLPQRRLRRRHHRRARRAPGPAQGDRGIHGPRLGGRSTVRPGGGAGGALNVCVVHGIACRGGAAPWM